ncbi:unnamed protein product [Pieris brassicae]|uniref:PiggyBac transposable element-derived protein domain-containing protein n=1 Tax=Pieris brassicae TaxID=7116 RepID=A0A9P0XGT8_PIEBR|nr:unnamed protein product [Pieris brassicae]
MITTKNHPSIVEVKDRFGKSRLKPVEVEIYNRYMSGIDRSDQMISYYSCPRKTIRWYKKVLFHCLDMAVWNAFFLYRKYKKDNANTYHFVHYREELIRVMIDLKDSKPRDLFSNSNSIHDSRRFRPNQSSAAHHEANVSLTANAMRGHWPEQMAARPGTKKKFAFLKCSLCPKSHSTRNELSLQRVPR